MKPKRSPLRLKRKGMTKIIVGKLRTLQEGGDREALAPQEEGMCRPEDQAPDFPIVRQRKRYQTVSLEMLWIGCTINCRKLVLLG